MKQATKANTRVGETVVVPIHGEFMHDEQLMIDYEVVLALRCKVKPENQIIGTGQKPMPEYMEFNDEMAYKLQ